LRGWEVDWGYAHLRRYAIEHGGARVVIGWLWDVEWVLVVAVV
jgi:hypothetical protein